MGVSFHSSDSDWGAWRQVQETMNNNFTYPIQHNDLMKACGIHLTKTFSTYHSDKYQFLFSHFLGFSPLRITFPNLCSKTIIILLCMASWGVIVGKRNPNTEGTSFSKKNGHS